MKLQTQLMEIYDALAALRGAADAQLPVMAYLHRSVPLEAAVAFSAQCNSPAKLTELIRHNFNPPLCHHFSVEPLDGSTSP